VIDGQKSSNVAKRFSILGLIALFSIGLVSCSSNSNTSASTTVPAHPSVTIVAQNVAPYGIILTFDGRTLYHFLKDGPNVSNCVGACLKIWPPLLVSKNTIVRGTSLAKGVFGVIKTSAGYQVTYNEEPLYFFSGDSKPGQTNGEGYKNLWYVVSASAMPVTSSSPSSSTSSTMPTTSSGNGY